MLAPQVVVASLAALGERGVVVFQAVYLAGIGDADEQGSAVAVVCEPGDGLDDRVLQLRRLLSQPHVPAHRRLVLQELILTVGADQFADRARALAGDPSSLIDVRSVLL